MLWRKDFEVFAGVEAEDLLLGCCRAVVATTHLHRRAAAAPAVGREVARPEGVGGRQRSAVEDGVLVAYISPALRLNHPGYLQRNDKYAEMIAQVDAYIKQHLYA